MSKSFKERFAEAVKAIDAKESEFRTRFGDDWRNMAMMEAFKLLKESEEDSSNLDEAKEIGNEMDDLSTEELENIFKDRRPGILYSRYYKTDSKGYYQYLVVRKMYDSSNFTPTMLLFKKKPNAEGYYRDENGLYGTKKEGYKKLQSAKQIVDGWATGKKYDLMAEDHFTDKEIEKYRARFEKEQNHDALDAIDDYVAAEGDGNKAAAAKAAGKIKRALKEESVNEGFSDDGKYNGTYSMASRNGIHAIEDELVKFATSIGYTGIKSFISKRTKRKTFKNSDGMIIGHIGDDDGYGTRYGKIYKKPMKNMDEEMDMNESATSLETHLNRLKESIDEAKGEIVKLSMPLFIRLMEWAFEECKNDIQIHKVAESLSEITKVADMDDYETLIKEELDEAYGDAKYSLGKKTPEQIAQKKARWERHVAEVDALKDQISKAEEKEDHEQVDRLQTKLERLRAMGANLQAYDK